MDTAVASPLPFAPCDGCDDGVDGRDQDENDDRWARSGRRGAQRRQQTLRCPRPVRVAVDAVDAAGKTTLADELVAPLARAGRSVIRASIDGFQHSAAVRYERGRASPEEYFRDSFNHAQLVEMLLAPLGPGGACRSRRAIFDVRLDRPIDAPVEEASADAVLLFDGVFLPRPELRPYWDFSIFVREDFEVTVARAEARDDHLFGSTAHVRRRYANYGQTQPRPCPLLRGDRHCLLHSLVRPVQAVHDRLAAVTSSLWAGYDAVRLVTRRNIRQRQAWPSGSGGPWFADRPQHLRQVGQWLHSAGPLRATPINGLSPRPACKEYRPRDDACL